MAVLPETPALSHGPDGLGSVGFWGLPLALAVIPQTSGQMPLVQVTSQELQEPLEFAVRHRHHYITFM